MISQRALSSTIHPQNPNLLLYNRFQSLEEILLHRGVIELSLLAELVVNIPRAIQNNLGRSAPIHPAQGYLGVRVVREDVRLGYSGSWGVPLNHDFEVFGCVVSFHFFF